MAYKRSRRASRSRTGYRRNTRRVRGGARGYSSRSNRRSFRASGGRDIRIVLESPGAGGLANTSPAALHMARSLVESRREPQTAVGAQPVKKRRAQM